MCARGSVAVAQTDIFSAYKRFTRGYIEIFYERAKPINMYFRSDFPPFRLPNQFYAPVNVNIKTGP